MAKEQTDSALHPGVGSVMSVTEYRLVVRATPGRGAVDEYRIDAIGPHDQFVLVFSAEDRALLKVIPRLPKGERPGRDDGELATRGPFIGRRPLRAFPASPLHLENPLLVQDPRGSYTRLAWQVIEPRGDSLLFLIGQIAFREGPEYRESLVRVEWRRGEPWWSLVTEVAQHEEPPKYIGGVELVDGRIVLGRLIRPGEPAPPKPWDGL